MHFFPWILQHSRALDFAFYCLKGWTKLHDVNVIFNETDVFVGYIALVLCACATYGSNTWMVLVCLQWVLPASNQKKCKQWRLSLITQHKPIERSTDMVSWPKNLKFKLDWTVFTWKTCMSSAWLQSMFMHGRVPASRRPGTRDDKMQPNLAPPLLQRTIWRSRISKSKSDLVAHNSGSWGVRLLHDVLALFFRWRCKNLWIGGSSAIQTVGYFVDRFAKSFTLNRVFVGKATNVYPKIWFCQSIVLPQYHFAKVWFCQNIILWKSCFATISFFQNIILPKYCFAKIWWCQTFIAHFLGQMPALIDILKLLVSLRISGSSFVGSIKSLLKDGGSTGTITPCKWAKRQLESVDLEKDTKNSRKS